MGPVDNLCISEGRNWKPQLTVIINISAKADKNMVKAFKKVSGVSGWKCSRDKFSDPIDTDLTISKPSQRRVCTNNLLNQAEIRAAAGEDTGKFHKQLTDCWLCNNERCINSTHQKGWCFVDWDGDHFNIDEKQHVQWAKTIMQGDLYVTIEQPF